MVLCYSWGVIIWGCLVQTNHPKLLNLYGHFQLCSVYLSYTDGMTISFLHDGGPSLIEPYHGLFLVAKSRYNGTRQIHQDTTTTATAHLHTPHLWISTVLLLSMKAVYIVIIAYPLHFLLSCQVCGVVFSLSIISIIGIWKNTYSTTQPVTTEIK